MCSETLKSGVRIGAELAIVSTGPHNRVHHDNADVDLAINPVSHVGQS